jgi:hypothetical protein
MAKKKTNNNTPVEAKSTVNDQVQVVTPYVSVTITSKEPLETIKNTVESLMDKYKHHHLITSKCNECG